MYFYGLFRHLCLLCQFLNFFIVRSDFAHASDNFQDRGGAIIVQFDGMAST